MTVGGFATSKIQQLYSSGPLSRFDSQYAFDALAWMIAIVLAEILRYEFAFSRIVWAPLLVLCVAACAVQLFFGSVFFLYRGQHPYGSFAEVRAVVFAVTVTAVIVGTPVLVFGAWLDIPRSILLIASPVALVLESIS